jgi:PadR family transcriptional regulator, regulatory protein AphA
MSLKHAILGFLNYHPMSGYDLKRVFDTSIQHFWPADQSQIYRELAALDEAGWAEAAVVRQDDRPDRKVYHISPAGREELTRWLSTPLPPARHRSAELIQVFFAGQRSDEDVLATFRQEAERVRAVLDRFAAVPALAQPYRDDVQSPREWFFWMLTLEAGIENARSHLRWVESVIERLENGQAPGK